MRAKIVGNTQLVKGTAAAIEDVLMLLKKEGVATKGNPDIYVRTCRQFGIDEARELRERAQLRPVGARRVFILATPNMTREAQNALLKTLEEPPADALFFFVVPSPETLLLTFLSRAQTLEVEGGAQESAFDTAHFLAATPQKRLDILRPLLEKGEDDKRDIAAIRAFLSSLEAALQKEPSALSAVYRAQKYMSDRGALMKPLLEQVALLVPRV